MTHEKRALIEVSLPRRMYVNKMLNTMLSERATCEMKSNEHQHQQKTRTRTATLTSTVITDEVELNSR